MKFNFVGTLAFNDADSDKPFIRKGTTKNGASYVSFNAAIVEKSNNRAFIESFGMKYDTIKTFDNDNNKIEIDWDNREDKSVIESVANYRKHVLEYDDVRHVFITEYDLIKHIQENIDNLKNRRWRVTGQTQLNEYKGKISHRFVVGNMYEVTDDIKNQLKVTIDEAWTAEDIDLSDWKNEKKIYINGFTKEYIDKDNGQKYIPQQIVLDASKVDFENEKHVGILAFKLKQLGIILEDDKVKSKAKKNKVYALPIVCKYINGAEEVEITEDMLSDNQKEAIALGLKELKDFVDGKAYAERVIMFKVSDFVLKGDSADGVYELDITSSEFDDEKYFAKAEETEEDIFEGNDTDDGDGEDDDEFEDIFG